MKLYVLYTRQRCGSIAGLLFHRGVLMSGSALSPWALVRGAANYAMQVAKHLNCSSVSTSKHVLPIAPKLSRASAYNSHYPHYPSPLHELLFSKVTTSPSVNVEFNVTREFRLNASCTGMGVCVSVARLYRN
jgi:hypothetical protein